MPSCQTFLIASFAWAALAHAAPLGAAPWTKLEGCRLVDSFLNDADSFLVAHGNKEYVVRLYFVDAPEVSELFPERVAEQAAYFSLSKAKTLELGRLGGEVVRRFLSGTFTLYTQWEDGRGMSKRHLAIVEKDGHRLSEVLVRNGMARIHGFKPPSAWPGGLDAVAMGRRLLELEAEAKQERVGGWGSLAPSPRLALAPAAAPPAPVPAANAGPRIDLNTADKKELQSLPGIGGTFAERIVEGRPWFDVEELKTVKGMRGSTFAGLAPLVEVKVQETIPETANFYRSRRLQWLNRQVSVSIAKVEEMGWPAPDGFAVLMAKTARDEHPGGSIPLFIPEERVERVMEHFRKPAKPVRTQALLYQFQGQDVLVIPRTVNDEG